MTSSQENSFSLENQTQECILFSLFSKVGKLFSLLGHEFFLQNPIIIDKFAICFDKFFSRINQIFSENSVQSQSTLLFCFKIVTRIFPAFYKTLELEEVSSRSNFLAMVNEYALKLFEQVFNQSSEHFEETIFQNHFKLLQLILNFFFMEKEFISNDITIPYLNQFGQLLFSLLNSSVLIISTDEKLLKRNEMNNIIFQMLKFLYKYYRTEDIYPNIIYILIHFSKLTEEDFEDFNENPNYFFEEVYAVQINSLDESFETIFDLIFSWLKIVPFEIVLETIMNNFDGSEERLRLLGYLNLNSFYALSSTFNETNSELVGSLISLFETLFQQNDLNDLQISSALVILKDKCNIVQGYIASVSDQDLEKEQR